MGYELRTERGSFYEYYQLFSHSSGTAEAELPSYAADGFLRQATGLLRYAHFAPNHADWPQYEAIVTEAIRAVQTRRLAPAEAVQFVTTRVRQQLRQQVRIVD